MVLKDVVNSNIVGACIRGRFSPRSRQTFVCSTPSLTLQSQANEADISRIVARHAETGFWSGKIVQPTRQPMYGDFSQPTDLLTAQKLLCTAKESFAGLSSEIRKEFNNDPLIMLQWLENPENRKRGVELGLLVEQSEHASLDVSVPTDTNSGDSPIPNDSEVFK